MQVVLLSYAEVLPEALRALRRAAAKTDVDLVEVEPHLLRLAIPGQGGEAQVMLAGKTLAADALLHRTVFPYRALVQPAVELLARRGTLVLNRFEPSLSSRNKALTLLRLSQAGLPTVPTTVLASALAAEDSDGLHVLADAELVLKPAAGAQGRGVRQRRGSDLLSAQEPGTYNPDDGPTVMQPLLRSPYDLRAYVVGGVCVAVGQRWSVGEEWRCNVSLGGRVTSVRDDGLRRQAETLSVQAVRCLGLDYAAVDLLVDADGSALLSEVDAWGGFTGLAHALDVDIASTIFDLVRSRWTP